MAKVAISLEEMSLGGGPKFSLNLGEALRAFGHDVTICVERPGPWWAEVNARGLTGYCFQAPRFESLAQRAKRLADYWNQSEFSVVIVNASLLNRLGMLASCLVPDDLRVVMILHGDWQTLYRLVTDYQAHWNCAVGVSPRVQAGAQNRLPHKPILGISNGIEVPGPEQLMQRRSWDSPLRLLYLGRLIDSHKGVLRLPGIIAACRRRGLPVTLTVVGDGEDAQALARQIDRQGMAESIALKGRVPPSETAQVMRDHHVLILPTNNEGMPLVVLEAEANGCVPIVTRLPGITDVAVEHGVTGRLIDNPDDAESFVKAVAELCDPTTWQRHSQAAIDQVHAKFSLEAMGRHYATLVEELAAGAYPLARPFNRDGQLASPPFGSRDRLPPYDPPPALVHAVRRTRRWIGRRLGRPEPRP